MREYSGINTDHERSGVVTTPHMKFRIEEGKLQRGVTQQVIRHHDAKMAMSILAEFLFRNRRARRRLRFISDKTDFFL